MKRPAACEYAERTFSKWQYLAAINVAPFFELIKQPYTIRTGHERKADTSTKACTPQHMNAQTLARQHTYKKRKRGKCD
jgi:hypothetical protein